MKTKQHLTPSDVPPGSAIRRESQPNQIWLAVAIEERGVRLWTGALWAWKDLMEAQILRPGESWQPCYKEVEEFNPADFKPGQEVDVATARKLHAAGVGLEYTSHARPKWFDCGDMVTCSDGEADHWGVKFRVSMPPGELTADELDGQIKAGKKVQYFDEWKNGWFDCGSELGNWNPTMHYRLKPAPVKRTMRQEELPERIIILDELYRISDKCYSVWHRDSVTDEKIEKVAKDGKWATNLDGPWNDFTVTEEQP